MAKDKESTELPFDAGEETERPSWMETPDAPQAVENQSASDDDYEDDVFDDEYDAEADKMPAGIYHAKCDDIESVWLKDDQGNYVLDDNGRRKRQQAIFFFQIIDGSQRGRTQRYYMVFLKKDGSRANTNRMRLATFAALGAKIVEEDGVQRAKGGLKDLIGMPCRINLYYDKPDAQFPSFNWNKGNSGVMPPDGDTHEAMANWTG